VAHADAGAWSRFSFSYWIIFMACWSSAIVAVVAVVGAAAAIEQVGWQHRSAGVIAKHAHKRVSWWY
jgi:hypothetical protein